MQVSSRSAALLRSEVDQCRWRKVGIVGGVGPLAGAIFYEELVNATPARNDSEHLPVFLISEPLPSRTACLLHGEPSPGPALRSVVSRLVELGAEVIAVPSSTCHAFYGEYSDVPGACCVNLVNEVCVRIRKQGWEEVGVLGTTATQAAAVYDSAASSARCNWRYPEPRLQAKVQEIIDSVKAGCLASQVAADFQRVLDGWRDDLNGLLLACTELATLEGLLSTELPVIYASRVLAQATVDAASR